MTSFRHTIRGIVERVPAPARLAVRNLRVRMSGPTRAQSRRQAQLFRMAGSPEAVLQGPFAGMAYPFRNRNSLGNHLTNLLGIYELELRGAVEQLCAASPDVVIDVGSGEGYYLIGLARRCPRARVIGFDTSAVARLLCARNAALNGVAGRLERRALCEPEGLRAALEGAQRPALVCDCEGCEDVLLDPVKVPELRRAIIIVEVHETELLVDPDDDFWRSQFDSGVSARLRQRFGASHDIEEFAERPRTPADKPPGCTLTDAEFLEASTELRGLRGLYFWMRPKA